MGAATDRALHQPGILQHPHMFRRAGEAHVEWRRQFPDRELLLGQVTKHRAARRVREGMEDSIEMGGSFNHLV